MSDDVAMTTGRLSVQPGFGIFRRAAGGIQTIWVFNLLSRRKQDAVSDRIMGGVGGAWVRVRYGMGGGNYKVRHQLNLCLRAQTWEMRKGGGCYFIFFLVFCYHPNPAMANYKDMRGTNKQINT